MLNKLESVLMPLAEKIGKNEYLIAIRDGFHAAVNRRVLFPAGCQLPNTGMDGFLGAVFRGQLGILFFKAH